MAQDGRQPSTEAADTIRIILADDHQVVRSGLRLLLDGEDGLEVVAEASDIDSARRYVRGHHPAVVRSAAAGESYLNPRLGARIASEPPPGPPDDLSEREVDVLRLIALGHTNVEIADQLYLSVRTVETHRSHIQQKLCLSTRAELVRYALDRGLIDSGRAHG